VIEMRRAQLRFDGVGPYLGHDAWDRLHCIDDGATAALEVE